MVYWNVERGCSSLNDTLCWEVLKRKERSENTWQWTKPSRPASPLRKLHPIGCCGLVGGRVLAGEGAAKMMVFQMNFVKRKIFCCFVARGRDLGESTLGVHNLGSSSQTERTSSLVLVLGVNCST